MLRNISRVIALDHAGLHGGHTLITRAKPTGCDKTYNDSQNAKNMIEIGERGITDSTCYDHIY